MRLSYGSHDRDVTCRNFLLSIFKNPTLISNSTTKFVLERSMEIKGNLNPDVVRRHFKTRIWKKLKFGSLLVATCESYISYGIIYIFFCKTVFLKQLTVLCISLYCEHMYARQVPHLMTQAIVLPLVCLAWLSKQLHSFNQ